MPHPPNGSKGKTVGCVAPVCGYALVRLAKNTRKATATPSAPARGVEPRHHNCGGPARAPYSVVHCVPAVGTGCIVTPARWRSVHLV